MNWIERQLERLRSVDPVVIDRAIALIFTVLGIASVFAQDIREDGVLIDGFRAPSVLACITVVLVCAPVAFRRRAPLVALVVSSIGILIHIGIGWPEGALPLAVLFLTYTVAAWCPLRTAFAGLGVLAVTVLLLGLTDSPGLDTVGALAVLAQFTAVWAIGVALRSRRMATDSRLREAEERAEAEHQGAARVLAEERLRIAQELHDVMAHSMSVIAVQAGVGVHVLDDRPEQARGGARGHLRDVTRDACRTPPAARRTAATATVGGPPYRHTELADLPQLVEDVRVVGVPVTLHVDGDADCIHAGIELSAYRVVQEALTNVIKHAGEPTKVDVTVRHLPSALVVEVVDDGRGLAARHGNGRHGDASIDGTGHGLVGMRERVELWGGELSVGPAPGGGYRVKALLPYGDAGMTIRVVVADDQALVRSGFTMLLAGEPEIDVVGEASNGVEAVALAASEHPDVMLMDVRMPVMDGLEATRRITEDPSLAATRILILTTFDLDEYVHEALRAGASGFLLKDTMPVDLLQAVRVVAAGDALIAPRIMRRLDRGVRATPRTGGCGRGDGRAGPAHGSRARGARTRRQGPVERRDRHGALREPRHREDARQPAAHEARRPRPRPARDDRLRDRCGNAGWLNRRSEIVEETTDLGRAGDRRVRVGGAREQVERSAAGRDVRGEEFGDGLRRSGRAVALESFERNVVQAFHRRRERRASGCGIVADAAPDLHRMLPLDVDPAGTAGGVVDDGRCLLEPSRRVPDADPAVAEAPGAAERDVGTTPDDDRDRWLRCGQDQGFVHVEELAVVGDRCSGEQGPQDAQRFVHAAPPGAWVDTADLELVRVLAADSDAEGEPAGVPLRHGGELSGHQHGMAQRQQIHRDERARARARRRVRGSLPMSPSKPAPMMKLTWSPHTT